MIGARPQEIGLPEVNSELTMVEHLYLKSRDIGVSPTNPHSPSFSRGERQSSAKKNINRRQRGQGGENLTSRS